MKISIKDDLSRFKYIVLFILFILGNSKNVFKTITNSEGKEEIQNLKLTTTLDRAITQNPCYVSFLL